MTVKNGPSSHDGLKINDADCWATGLENPSYPSHNPHPIHSTTSNHLWETILDTLRRIQVTTLWSSETKKHLTTSNAKEIIWFFLPLAWTDYLHTPEERARKTTRNCRSQTFFFLSKASQKMDEIQVSKSSVSSNNLKIFRANRTSLSLPSSKTKASTSTDCSGRDKAPWKCLSDASNARQNSVISMLCWTSHC